MKLTEQEKLQFGIEIVAAMFAERLHNGDLDAGMIDALSETELDRLGYSKEDLDAMPPDRLEMIRKMVSFHKTRLHQQAMFMANTVLSSGLISKMQPEWEWQVIDFYNQETFPLEDDPVLCFTEDGLQLLQLTKYGQTVVSWEWTTCFSKPVNKSFPIDFVKHWKNVEPPKDINQ